MRIDVHNHVIPQEALDLLDADAVYGVRIKPGRVWSGGVHVDFPIVDAFVEPDAKLAELDANGLGGAVVSVSPTIFYHHVDVEAGEAMARASNAGMAAFCAAAPERLAWLATVPLQDAERAVAVLEDAVELGAVGVEIGTSVARDPLDGERYAPFWAAAERLRMPVTLHPAYTTPHRGLEDFYLENVIGFPLETTIAIERLICAGVLDRHPGLEIVLLHAGGYFPWQAGRLRHARTQRPELADSPPDPFAYLGQLWIDVITHDGPALSYLVERVGADRVVLGTDLPFDMAPPDPLALVRAGCPDAAVQRRICEENPRTLYPALRRLPVA